MKTPSRFGGDESRRGTAVGAEALYCFDIVVLLFGSSEVIETSPRSMAEVSSPWRGAKSEVSNPTNYPKKLGAIVDRAATHPHSLATALAS